MLFPVFCLLVLSPVDGVNLKIQNLLSGFVNCPANWWEWKGHCYNLFCDPVGLTHGEAEAACVKEGGHLASIEDQTDADMLTEESQMGLTSGDSYIEKQPWIGLKRRGLIWVWTDGTSKNWGFRWAPGTPDDEKGNEYCAQLVIHPVYSWATRTYMYRNKTAVVNDYDCNRKVNRYFCKKPFEKKTISFSTTTTTTTTTSTSTTTSTTTSSTTPQATTVKLDESKSRILSSDIKTSEKTTKIATSTKVTTAGPSCKPGDFDILDTDLPEKQLYSGRGMKCISRQPCSSMKSSLSVVFAVDASSSIGRQNWDGVLSFVYSSSHMLPKSSKVGFVKYSDAVSAEVWLEPEWTMETFWEKLPKDFDQGFTNTPAALEAAGRMLKNDQNDKSFVILITDGLPKAEGFGESKGLQITQEAIDNLTLENINLLIVGYGSHLAEGEEKLKNLLRNPSDYFGYYIAAMNLTPLHMANVLMNVCVA